MLQILRENITCDSKSSYLGNNTIENTVQCQLHSFFHSFSLDVILLCPVTNRLGTHGLVIETYNNVLLLDLYCRIDEDA